VLSVPSPEPPVVVLGSTPVVVAASSPRVSPADPLPSAAGLSESRQAPALRLAISAAMLIQPQRPSGIRSIRTNFPSKTMRL